MTVVINGSGTITGISTGGLPDGIVDDGTLATSAVTSTKILDGTITNADINASAAIVASKLSGTGKVLQVKHFSFTTDVTCNSALTTLFSTNFTPVNSTSNIIIDFRPQGRMDTPNSGNVFEYGFKIKRTGSTVSDLDLLLEVAHTKSHYHNDGSYLYETIIGVGTVQDTPNTTSQVTYTFSALIGGASNNYGILKVNAYSAVSTVLITEVLP
jgi:hypothetical protein